MYFRIWQNIRVVCGFIPKLDWFINTTLYRVMEKNQAKP